jgi:hypothetical protein
MDRGLGEACLQAEVRPAAVAFLEEPIAPEPEDIRMDGALARRRGPSHKTRLGRPVLIEIKPELSAQIVDAERQPLRILKNYCLSERGSRD